MTGIDGESRYNPGLTAAHDIIVRLFIMKDREVRFIHSTRMRDLLVCNGFLTEEGSLFWSLGDKYT